MRYLIILAVILALALPIYIGSDLHLAGYGGKAAKTSAFSPYIQEYLSIPAKSLEGAPYITGKVITVDKSRNEIDLLFLLLPDNLRATDPGEVGTIVHLERGEALVGTYTDGSKGYQGYCKVTIINKARAGAFEAVCFNGASAPQTKSVGGDWHGAAPDKIEIAEYLKKLPQR